MKAKADDLVKDMYHFFIGKRSNISNQHFNAFLFAAADKNIKLEDCLLSRYHLNNARLGRSTNEDRPSFRFNESV